MKKILALLLALLMALSCTGVLAEAAPNEIPETETEPEIVIQADLGEGLQTITGSLQADTNTLMMILNMMGLVDEEMLPTITSILNVLNSASVKLGMFENGSQADVLLQDTPVVTIAGAEADGNIAVASDLIPNYLVLVSEEYAMQIAEQYLAQAQAMIEQSSGAAASIDPEALMSAVMPHVMAFISAIEEKIGEPEAGEYVFEDTTFQAKVPVNLTVKEAAALISDLLHGILAEEAVAGLMDAVASMNIPVDVNRILESVDSAITNIQETPDEELPALEIALYSGMDENGANSNIYITLDLIKDEEGISACGGKIGTMVYAHLNALGQLALDISAGITDEGMIKALVNVNFSGMFIGIDAQVAGMSDITVALYFMNPMAPVVVLSLAIEPGAESTLAVDSEGKTVVTLEQLMNDETGEVSTGLLMDVMSNGLGGLLGKAMQILPEDMSALLGMLNGSGTGSAPEIVEE